MNYIDNHLLANETIIYRAQLHWVVFLLPAILMFLGIKYILFFPIGLLIGISAAINYLTSEFAVTNKRIMVKVGFIQRRSLEILPSKIEGIAVNQSIFGRLLNYGTITVVGMGGTREPFATIAAPMEFRQKAQEQISAVQDK